MLLSARSPKWPLLALAAVAAFFFFSPPSPPQIKYAVSYAEATCHHVNTCAAHGPSACGEDFEQVDSKGCHATCCPKDPPADTCYNTDVCDGSCAPEYELMPRPTEHSFPPINTCSRFCCTPGSSFWYNSARGCPDGYVHRQFIPMRLVYGSTHWYLCFPRDTPHGVGTGHNDPSKPGSVAYLNTHHVPQSLLFHDVTPTFHGPAAIARESNEGSEFPVTMAVGQSLGVIALLLLIAKLAHGLRARRNAMNDYQDKLPVGSTFDLDAHGVTETGTTTQVVEAQHLSSTETSVFMAKGDAGVTKSIVQGQPVQ